MNAKQIREGLTKAQEKQVDLTAELAQVQAGPRSKEDAQRVLAVTLDDLERRLQRGLRESITGVGYVGSMGAEARERCKLVIGDRPLPEHFITGAARLGFGDVSGWGAVPFLVAMNRAAFEGQMQETLDGLPKSAFGPSQAERDQREKQLRADLEATEKEITLLTAAWHEEVGGDVPVPRVAIEQRKAEVAVN